MKVKGCRETDEEGEGASGSETDMKKMRIVKKKKKREVFKQVSSVCESHLCRGKTLLELD